jgi:hypothetical protein
MAWSGQYGKWRFVYISFIPGTLNPFTHKNYLYPPLYGFSCLEHHVYSGSTKHKQNLTTFKVIQGHGPLVPFLASGLYSFMAIAFVFVKLSSKDSVRFLVGPTCEQVPCFLVEDQFVHFLSGLPLIAVGKQYLQVGSLGFSSWRPSNRGKYLSRFSQVRRISRSQIESRPTLAGVQISEALTTIQID